MQSQRTDPDFLRVKWQHLIITEKWFIICNLIYTIFLVTAIIVYSEDISIPFYGLKYQVSSVLWHALIYIMNDNYWSYNQNSYFLVPTLGFPGASVTKKKKKKKIHLSSRRHGFDPWVGNNPQRRKWQSTPVFCLGNTMDRGAWRATVHGVMKSRTRLID